MSTDAGTIDVSQRVAEFLAANDPTAMSEVDFWGARFDAGLAWVHFPVGLGGLDAPRSLQGLVEDRLTAAGAPYNDQMRNPIGMGMAAPTLLYHGAPPQQALLRSLWTGEEVWCQLFSEPGAGSDLAGLATRAVQEGGAGGDWIVNGQKVWTSMAHFARWGLLLTRTDPTVPKHQGMTYFVLDMYAPGVEIKPLRQATGQADFNEIFLTDVRLADSDRLDAVGAGWVVARTTLMSERAAIGGSEASREQGHVGRLAALWRERPELRTMGMYPKVIDAWLQAEVTRVSNERTRQLAATSKPGFEGAGAKVMFARNNQLITRIAARLSPDEALEYDGWSMGETLLEFSRPESFHHLRALANSIEGGTTEILLGQIADRVLDLPKEPKIDPNLAWQDIPK
ncbi:MAG: acyl-CoA dehydrogenase [Pseudonocardiales bacterium]|nr:acyl-CoA dehydrogenase [Pseudonocardiales bacterium]